MLMFLRRRTWMLVSAVVVITLGLGGCDDGDDGDDMVGSAATQYMQ